MHILAAPGGKYKNLNPYNYLIYEPMKRHGITVTEYGRYIQPIFDADVFHIHWPEHVVFGGRTAQKSILFSKWAALKLIYTMDKIRQNGGINVLTVHNLKPHSRYSEDRETFLEDLLHKEFYPRIDLVLSMTKYAKKLALEAIPELRGKEHVVIPHPHYRTSFAPPPDKVEARRLLSIPPNCFVLAFIGNVEPYKNVLETAKLFTACAKEDELLLICGKCTHEAYCNELSVLVEQNDNIQFQNSFVSDEKLPQYLSASSALVYNYDKILNSGSVLLALSFDRPALTVNMGSLAELRSTVGEEWVVTFDSPLDADSLRKVIDLVRTNRQEGETAPLNQFAPETVSDMTLDAYRQRLGR